ncbi:MAG: hypothetical protein IPJ75_17220 [Ignavibacteriales bacterium]|nr:hypothetical protein [Ignavibacteriales bacterium]
MSFDFINSPCRESPRIESKFGICDDQVGTKAYTDSGDDSKWIAFVRNEDEKEITFTAIDNCLEFFKNRSQEKESTCDGMLTFDDGIYFVELKTQDSNWLQKALGQLENTIILLQNHHRNYRFKKAFACNKRHPSFHVFDNELNKRFFKQYGFRIDINNEIIIK